MKTAFLAGILLVALGVLAVGYQGVMWVTTRENVVKAGPIEINREKETPIPIWPIAGGVAVVAGLALMMRSGRASS